MVRHGQKRAASLTPESENGNSWAKRLRLRVTKDVDKGGKGATETTADPCLSLKQAEEVSVVPQLEVGDEQGSAVKSEAVSGDVTPEPKPTGGDRVSIKLEIASGLHSGLLGEVDSGIHSEGTAPSPKGKGTTGSVRKVKPPKVPNPPKEKKEPKQDMKGYTPGRTPYGDEWVRQGEEYERVYQILAEAHQDLGDRFIQKPTNPRASIETAGCGEVRLVIDALLRTCLSAATTMQNANRALQGLAREFGLVFKGTDLETINWDAVRRAPRQVVKMAIQTGGLGTTKTKTIKDILDQVWEQGLARLSPNGSASAEGWTADPNTTAPTGPKTSIAQMTSKPAIATSKTTTAAAPTMDEETIMSILSLEHLRNLPTVEAIKEMIQFSGVGVKTAACVSLFCLRKDCFAVDTHVHRFCRWLGWVPQGEKDERRTFNHCELQVPAHLKYGLHQLFIIHGTTCFRCKADTKPGTKDWVKSAACPLEGLLHREKKADRVEKGQQQLTGFLESKPAPTDSNTVSHGEPDVEQNGDSLEVAAKSLAGDMVAVVDKQETSEEQAGVVDEGQDAEMEIGRAVTGGLDSPENDDGSELSELGSQVVEESKGDDSSQLSDVDSEMLGDMVGVMGT